MIKKLPEGWVLTTIGAIADTTSGGTPLRSHNEYYGGSIPWVKSGELRDGIIQNVEETITELGLNNSSAKIYPKGAVVVALYGATVGRTGILGLDAASNQAVCSIFPRNDSFIPKYMFYWLQSQRQNLVNQSVGGAQPNISQGIIRALAFPFAPLPEQERIVARIESLFTQLDAGVAGLKRAQAALKRYRASVLKAAVEGKLTREWRETHQEELEPASELLDRIIAERRAKWEAEAGKGKYKEPRPPDTDNLPELPERWVWASLEQLSWHSSYGTSQKCDYESEGPSVIRIPNIQNGRLNLSDLKFATKPSNLPNDKAIEPHDLLIIRTNGSIDLIGRSALVRNKTKVRYFFASYLIRFRILPEYNISLWISFLWNSHLIRNWMVGEIATTAGQYNINIAKLNRIQLPIPPSAEQDKIIALAESKLSLADEIEKELDHALARAGRLRQSILKLAFEGRLTKQIKIDGNLK